MDPAFEEGACEGGRRTPSGWRALENASVFCASWCREILSSNSVRRDCSLFTCTSLSNCDAPWECGGQSISGSLRQCMAWFLAHLQVVGELSDVTVETRGLGRDTVQLVLRLVPHLHGGGTLNKPQHLHRGQRDQAPPTQSRAVFQRVRDCVYGTWCSVKRVYPLLGWQPKGPS